MLKKAHNKYLHTPASIFDISKPYLKNTYMCCDRKEWLDENSTYSMSPMMYVIYIFNQLIDDPSDEMKLQLEDLL